MAKELPASQKKLMTRKRVIVIAILTAAILAFVMFSSHGILSRIAIAADASQLGSTLSNMKREEDSLRVEINKLLNDTLEIERLARERYGYVRLGEKVFVIKREHK
ncbi:MAG: septum formation initiator family protein [Ignavibacteria bacterium]|jgi:cell division protein FtsB|nr:septum formation initiator family protein [Ignavibacteria bacterium]